MTAQAFARAGARIVIVAAAVMVLGFVGWLETLGY